MATPDVVAFHEWIDKVTPELLPPVCNKMLYNNQLKVMVVAGPNIRKDFHMEEGEELFYQIKGDMRLDIMECGKLREVVIREGEMFLLPGRIPHSPQRFENTLGLVLERERLPTEADGLRWYSKDGETPLYEEWFHCEDLGTQLVPAIKRFFDSDAHKTGEPQGVPSEPQIRLDTTTRPPAPINFNALTATPTGPAIHDLFTGEFKIRLVHGTAQNHQWINNAGETLLLQFGGSCTVHYRTGAHEHHHTKHLAKNDIFLVPAHSSYSLTASEDSVCLISVNNVV